MATAQSDENLTPRRMVELLELLTTREGLHPSELPGVRLMRTSRPLPRQPVLYEPSMIFIAQGRKCGYLGDQAFLYDANHYLVSSVPLPFECETFAGEHGPLLGMKVDIDMTVLGELLLRLPPGRPIDPDAGTRSIYSTPIDPVLGQTAVRLLEAIANPADRAVLGPSLIRELTYRVLCGKHGDSLRALAGMHGRLAHVLRAIQRIHDDYAKPIDVSSLADDVAMSVSAFHHHFKSVTATSPLQYLKSIRLHKARLLMAQDGLGAAEAAAKVGYESASQFSREFKRFFGHTPSAELNRLREMLGLDQPVTAAVSQNPSTSRFDRSTEFAYPVGPIASGMKSRQNSEQSQDWA
jgi:AraC-like DNA-binding protein